MLGKHTHKMLTLMLDFIIELKPMLASPPLVISDVLYYRIHSLFYYLALRSLYN
jgi:hypothetical protein